MRFIVLYFGTEYQICELNGINCLVPFYQFWDTVNAFNLGSVPNCGGSNKMRFISILHYFFGQTVRFESLSKKLMQGTKESHFFDPQKLETPPKLEALTVFDKNVWPWPSVNVIVTLVMDKLHDILNALNLNSSPKIFLSKSENVGGK